MRRLKQYLLFEFLPEKAEINMFISVKRGSRPWNVIFEGGGVQFCYD